MIDYLELPVTLIRVSRRPSTSTHTYHHISLTNTQLSYCGNLFPCDLMKLSIPNMNERVSFSCLNSNDRHLASWNSNHGTNDDISTVVLGMDAVIVIITALLVRYRYVERYVSDCILQQNTPSSIMHTHIQYIHCIYWSTAVHIYYPHVQQFIIYM